MIWFKSLGGLLSRGGRLDGRYGRSDMQMRQTHKAESFASKGQQLKSKIQQKSGRRTKMPERGTIAHQKIPDDEFKLFADLPGKLLKFDPKDCISARAAQDHERSSMYTN